MYVAGLEPVASGYRNACNSTIPSWQFHFFPINCVCCMFIKYNCDRPIPCKRKHFYSTSKIALLAIALIVLFAAYVSKSDGQCVSY